MSETKEKGLMLQDMKLTTSIEDLLKSETLPPGINSKERIMTVAQYGRELGMEPMTAINNISIIKGKMVISSTMLGAMLKKRGYEYLWTKDHVTEEDGRILTELEIFWFSKTLKREFSQKFAVSWQELELAGLTANPTYGKYRKVMHRWKTLAFAVRAVAPEILLGMYTDEEIISANPDSGMKVEVNPDTDELIIIEESTSESNDDVKVEDAVIIEDNIKLKPAKKILTKK
jgi:hypothetical protein